VTARFSRCAGPVTPTGGLVFLMLSLWTAGLDADVGREWNFKVFLDNKPIGYHSFQITREGHHEQLNTRADFNVTFLKIPVYRYRHENVEHWHNQCLQSIASETDQNGELFAVQGAASAQGFRLTTNEGDTILPACVSTFAYWDKAFLKHDRLLNTQTGEYLEVEVENLGMQTIPVRDATITANRYKIIAEEIDIDIWYSGDGQWLALQSTTSNGQVLRYVIQ
jgi:Domain of unknown function (DUF6134)